MAALANTFMTTNAVGNREELSDVVSRITPEDTPLWSMIGSETADSKHPEWEIDDLGAPENVARPEGDEFTFASIAPPVRVGNYAEIKRRDWIISASQDAVSNAGRVEQTKEQKLKKGVQIRKDFELAFLSNTASVATDPRRLGGLPSWLVTNVSRGATGANGGYSTGTGLTVAATNGTQRAFTKTLLDQTANLGYINGANFKTLMVSPYVKSVFVTFMSDANVASFRYAAEGSGKNTVVATADLYEGPFGKLTVTPNRVMAFSAATARNAFLIDPEMLSKKVLRKIHNVKDLAKTGDAEKGVIIGEMTLKVKNEKGLGVIADIFGLSATT